MPPRILKNSSPQTENGVDEKEDGDRPVASIQRALLVLDAFLGGDPTLTLAEIADRTGLPKSTILRVLSTLEQQDYVVRTRSGEFHVGPKPLRLANSFQNAMQPEDLVVPVLRELVEKTGESASYIVRQNHSRVTLYRVDSPQPIRDHGRPGDVVPLDRGSAAQVLLAFSEEPGKFPQVRERLVAVSHGEIHAGMTGLASPVFNSSRECQSAIALTGPETRFTPALMPKLQRHLLEAARTLTVRMGGNGRLFDEAIARIGAGQ
jgi:DNA-binding IclR family transcriptional regulator